MSTRGLRKTREGVVISDKMDKSVIVEVSRTVMHPLYQKYVRKRTVLKAHDEKNEAKVGDKVSIAETRPLSARKRWVVTSIVEKAKEI